MLSWLNGLNNSILPYQIIASLGLLLVQIVVLICLVYHIITVKKAKNLFNNLIAGVEGGNLEQVLTNLGVRLDSVEKGLTDLETSVEVNRKNGELHIQRWSLLRYKAFSNTGGDQSFSLALLDGKGNGVVLSSIYGRDESRVYAKSISEGHSTYPMSSEENDALQQALGKDKK